MTQETLQDRIEYYNSIVPVIFQPGEFPDGFRLKPKDWALNDDVVNRESIDAVIDGTKQKIRPIGTMDIEFLSNGIIGLAKAGKVDLVENYPCGLNCPGCFSEEKVYGDVENFMRWQEVVKAIDDARTIGLASVKFLGPGELFQNPDLFDILDALKAKNIPISIFTKGAELGDDGLARKVYRNLGIETAEQLVLRIANYDNVRILLGFNSFFQSRQDKAVGSAARITDYEFLDGRFVNRGISDYTTKRDMALVNLTRAGFNSLSGGQRLSLIATPVMMDQIDEVADMYSWAAKRNIPMIIAPTMESGPKSLKLVGFNKYRDPAHEKLTDMMVKVYSRAIDEGIMTLDQIRQEGVSAYMGTSPCNQVSNGLFMRLNGQVQLCPGRSDEQSVYGNVHTTHIEKLWRESPNYRRTDLTNNWCVAKKDGMPQEIQTEVLRRLNLKYA